MKIAYVIIGAVILAGLAGAGGFFGGMTYAQSQAQTTTSDFARQRGIPDAANGQGGANATGANPCGFGNFQFPQGAAQGGATQGGVQANGAQNNGQGGTQGTQGTQRRQGGQFGGFGGNFAQLGNCVARGQIKSVNGDTVEISTADSVVTVKVNGDTQITKTERGSSTDLQVGDRVTVFSKETGTNPTASGIQLQRNLPQPNQ